MKKKRIFGISILTLSCLSIGISISYANDIFTQTISTSSSSIFPDEKPDTTEVPTIIKNDSRSVHDLEYELAKKFVIKYKLFDFNINTEHNSITDKNFGDAISHYIDLTMDIQSEIIPGMEKSRKNFMTLLGKPLTKDCNNENCILNYIESNKVGDLKDNQIEREITNYEAVLLLWRGYIQYKAQYFNQNAIQDNQININKFIKSSKFSEFELIQYSSNSQYLDYSEEQYKKYGEVTCFYEHEEDSTTATCKTGNDQYPFYRLDNYKKDSSIQELLRLSTSSNELFLSQTSYY